MNATRYLPFAGPLLIGLPFPMSGLSKLAAIGPTTEMISAAGLPLPPLALALAVVVELGGGLLLVSGFWTRGAATAVFPCDRADIPQQLCRPEPDDPLPQERDDGRRAAPDRRVWGWGAQHRQPPHQRW